ncbi:whey acidic protein-like isoform X2 [Gigantopelta aegis]|nr:whey acidic protein-like isoform X2 [Gigantopelta aegis]
MQKLCTWRQCPVIYPVCGLSSVRIKTCGPGSGPVLDSNGIEMFCGRGSTRYACPGNTRCKTDPSGRFAVCCWAERKAVTKPGGCPKPRPGFDFCWARCSNDGDCPGPLKCCGRCVRECTTPVFKQKGGTCPITRSFGSKCIDYCQHDYNCPGNQKCCGRCPRVCKLPMSNSKPGKCDYAIIEFCSNLNPNGWCTTDSQCRGNQKCCPTNCGGRCSDPFIKW